MIGQTALDYLMTYGWVILIVLVVSGVLAYYGIFASQGFLAPDCSNCYNRIDSCYMHNCTCSDDTIYINPLRICGTEQPHYVIP